MPIGKSLIVSFHDLAPPTRRHCERFLQRLKQIGVDRASLLVVPRWQGGPPFTEDKEFVQFLLEQQAAGHEICLHGYYHRSDDVSGGLVSQFMGRVYTREGEFYQIRSEEAAKRLAHGLACFKQAGLPVSGFTPPAWLISEAGRSALRTAGLRYSTRWGEIELFEAGEILPAPTLVYSSRSALRRLGSRAWIRLWYALKRSAPILRIAAHPIDLDYPEIEQSLFRLVERCLEGRKSMTYQDLLPVPVEADLVRVAPPAPAG
jgi:uncharacterized protein